MNASPSTASLVTPAEHEQGWKDVVFPDRKVRLYAPDCHAAAAVAREVFERNGPIGLFVIECLTNPEDPESVKAAHRLHRELRQIRTAREFSALVDICVELTFGQTFMQDMRKLLANLEAKEQAA